ncbi:MAG: hypothetical protein HN712_20595 [Gemmatimonadetes bacterium]|nr:hypothetical protein [Gemmatimonadota bacterium]MBT6146489.1 hypothetical protein [Gemmatimonadota bacterium]MBT7862726.1 hypothetical protein [Gemmatimonadota bacterium]
MKSIQSPIDVDTDDLCRPVRLYWRSNTYHVSRILDRWVLQNRWWAREERRLYVLVEATLGVGDAVQHLELYLRGTEWMLARVVD